MIRVYPKTESPAILEKLAEVPAGTMRKLNGLKARYVYTRKGVRYYMVPGMRELFPVRDANDYETMVDAEFSRIYNAEDDVVSLHSFLMNGWGRLSAEASRYLRELGFVSEDGYCSYAGEVGPDSALELLRKQGVCVSNYRNAAACA